MPNDYHILPNLELRVEQHDPIYLSTVSAAFIQDWLEALSVRYDLEASSALLKSAGFGSEQINPDHRVTLSQIARLYQLAAIETGDEMMGLWSRPIRPRALQHLVTVMREAGSPTSALFRFSTFWNLLLDDFRVELQTPSGQAALKLIPYTTSTQPQRFGHMLLLKLAHGLLSWLTGAETQVKDVQFAFGRPDFARDYAVVFPCQVYFDAEHTGITFETDTFGPLIKRTGTEASEFLQRAPLDWIFTGSRAHLYGLRVRAFMFGATWEACRLPDAAASLGVTPRTLIRRLSDEGTSFQDIKDALRRDMAIRSLQHGDASIDSIALETGFSAPANFHRAFRKWTGQTPGSFRSMPKHQTEF
ncbi:MAG: AraC family transcriptional regulator ligand-binding domain-containing protein [Pseudomonadota bacterium]